MMRLDSMVHLKSGLESAELCIFSTGSYTEGEAGFVEALVEQKLLPENALEKLPISGAIIDWNTRTVTHANIADNKIKGLLDLCKQHGHEFVKDKITGIYINDPWGNDSGLWALKPQCTHLIRTIKNKDKHFAELTHEDW